MKQQIDNYEPKLEKGFKSVVCDILGITPRSYSNYKADGRPIIAFFENNFSKYDLEQFLETGSIPALKLKELNEQTIQLQSLVEEKVLKKIIEFYKSTLYVDDNHHEGLNARGYKLVKLILKTAETPIYSSFKASFFSEEFRNSIENILSYEWSDMSNEDCEADASHQQQEIIQLIYSLDEISLMYLEQFSSKLQEQWKNFIVEEKNRYQQYMAEQELIAIEQNAEYENLSDKEKFKLAYGHLFKEND